MKVVSRGRELRPFLSGTTFQVEGRATKWVVCQLKEVTPELHEEHKDIGFFQIGWQNGDLYTENLPNLPMGGGDAKKGYSDDLWILVRLDEYQKFIVPVEWGEVSP